MPSSSPTTPRSGERGFGLIEIIVAMTIIATLSAVVYFAFLQGRGTTRSKEARTVGVAYAQAITQYQVQNANHNPPAGAPSTNPKPWRGPTNLMGKPYMKNLPEAVSKQRTLVSGTCETPTAAATTPPRTNSGFVAYCPLAEPHFEVRVWTRMDSGKPWPGQPTCIVGNSPQTAAPTC